MPEHIHLLVSEPEVKDLAKAIQALKISVARRRMRYHDKDGTTLWQKRYLAEALL
jgi:REP element-mobilizing transposase RayT